MKKLIIVDVPDGVEFKVDSFNYGFYEPYNGSQRYVSYNIPVKEVTLPNEEDLFVGMCDYFSVDFDFAQSPDFYAGSNYVINKILNQ